MIHSPTAPSRRTVRLFGIARLAVRGLRRTQGVPYVVLTQLVVLEYVGINLNQEHPLPIAAPSQRSSRTRLQTEHLVGRRP